MARKGGVLAVAAAMLLLAACSGSDGDAAPSTTPAPVATTVATPAPTTANAPSTTQAPTTTIDPAQTLAAEVEADFREAIRLGDEALQEPFDAARAAAALDRRLGVVRENFAERLARYRTENLAIRQNETVPATIVVEQPARRIPPSDDVIEMQVCEVDSWIVVEVGAGPNGTDAVVNPDVVAYRAQIFMRNVDGIWRYEGGNDLASWEGVASCPEV
jgi:hypothetical protein